MSKYAPLTYNEWERLPLFLKPAFVNQIEGGITKMDDPTRANDIRILMDYIVLLIRAGINVPLEVRAAIQRRTSETDRS